ncbi:MAG: hypothetical protein CVV32_04190 [Methanomicrobiales archaeon HGW-Methanomicrobiales-3]|jgi:hypothetical protein|nr:MAG: hypothetical protein CVV32_04190 [Methanomicrobiales archaeon HGW-Methanomicrobiales-3]
MADSTFPDPAPRKNLLNYLVWIFIAATLLLAIIFWFNVFGILSGTSMKTSECSFCADPMTDSAPAIRTGPDSIHIVMRPDASIHHHQVPVVNIYVNDRDVSNQSLIAAADLAIVISPPEGLVFADGSSVTLSGSGVAGNTSMPVHLQVVASYPDTGKRVAIGEQLF